MFKKSIIPKSTLSPSTKKVLERGEKIVRDLDKKIKK